MINDVLLFYKIALGFEDCGQKVGEKSCQSNFDTQASDFGSFLVI